MLVDTTKIKCDNYYRKKGNLIVLKDQAMCHNQIRTHDCTRIILFLFSASKHEGILNQRQTDENFVRLGAHEKEMPRGDCRKAQNAQRWRRGDWKPSPSQEREGTENR